jgi:hypothetical protein
VEMHISRSTLFQQAIWSFLLIFILAGCAAPFSDYQSARLAGKYKGEVTANYSLVSLKDAKVQDQVGVQGGFGITDNADIRIRYERIYFEDSDGIIEVFGFGPKFSLRSNNGALYLPVGFAFGEDVETSKSWEFHPTLLVTRSFASWLELNISAKAMISLVDEGPDARLSFNVGLGIGPNITRLIFRPEAGVMICITDADDPFFHIGVGMSFANSDKKRIAEFGDSSE